MSRFVARSRFDCTAEELFAWHGRPGAVGRLVPPWERVLALPGVHLHLYGKREPRPARKMGHLTVTAADAATARRVALEAAGRLGLPAF